MARRLSRSERQEQTREKLVAAAQRVFLRRGFHGAALNEVAEAAGFTTGAVYSNFSDKDELFLAVLDAENARRFPLHAQLSAEAESFEAAIRASIREYVEHAKQFPGWAGVYVEFWTHASRRPELRRLMAERQAALLTTAAQRIEALAARFQLELIVPARDAARGFYALSRGLGLEHLLGLAPVSPETFETLALALTQGLARPRTDHQGDDDGPRTVLQPASKRARRRTRSRNDGP